MRACFEFALLGVELQSVQTKQCDVYQGQRSELPRLSPDHAQMPQ